MSASEDESRANAVGRKRNLQNDPYDRATAEGNSAKQPRLTETPSISSKESGEISDSGASRKEQSPQPQSQNGSIFERWGRRKVVIPLPGATKKPSVLETTAEQQNHRDRYFDESPSSGELSTSTDSSTNSSDSDDSDEESDGEESDYEPPFTISSPEKNMIADDSNAYPTPPTREIRVRDLSDVEQDLQYRYFWDVQEHDLVYCLCCGKRGHMRENCMERICKHCNAVDKHTSNGCPTFRKCTHCRQRGHDAPDCTNLGRTFLQDDPCDVCGESGHFEVECLLRSKPATKVEPEKEADSEEPVEQPGTPPAARSWMLGLFDDARD